MPTPILVTGAAGFVGYHVAQRLLRDGHHVVGVDSFTPYYDVALKEARFSRLLPHNTFLGERMDLADPGATRDLFARHRFERVIHLAAQPGVRFVDPQPYVASNLVAFTHMLEACRHNGVRHLVYASSSSVYGANRQLPFTEHAAADHPISLYAATKKANEMMAHSYAHLFGLPVTGLRFFTVYGPWGRPDMAVYTFTRAIAEGREIRVANAGNVWRDFTYVDDIVEGVVRVAFHDATPDPSLECGKPRSGHQQRAFSPLQYRQRPSRRGQHADRADRERARPQGEPRRCPAAARRRAGNPRRRVGPAPRRRLRAVDFAGGRHRALCGMVPGLSWRVRC